MTIVLQHEVQPTTRGIPLLDAKTLRTYTHLFGAAQDIGLDLMLASHLHTNQDHVRQGWTCRNGIWIPQGERVIDSVYDRLIALTPEEETVRRRLKASMLNPVDLADLMDDKVATYELLPELSIPTKLASPTEVVERMEEFRNTTLHPDLSQELYIVKPRRGKNGEGIYLLTWGKEIPKLPAGEYVVQPFLETDSGIPTLSIQGRHDFRFMFVNENTPVTFVREPQEHGIVSNWSQGGAITYYPQAHLPQDLRDAAEHVDDLLSAWRPRTYSADFGRGNSGTWWLYELNAKPLFGWNESINLSEEQNKAGHRAIVEALKES